MTTGRINQVVIVIISGASRQQQAASAAAPVARRPRFFHLPPPPPPFLDKSLVDTKGATPATSSREMAVGLVGATLISTFTLIIDRASFGILSLTPPSPPPPNGSLIDWMSVLAHSPPPLPVSQEEASGGWSRGPVHHLIFDLCVAPPRVTAGDNSSCCSGSPPCCALPPEAVPQRWALIDHSL